MPPGSRQAMPMTATGVCGVLIIGAKDIADPESAPHYVSGRTKPFPPHSNSGLALWAAFGCLPRRHFNLSSLSDRCFGTVGPAWIRPASSQCRTVNRCVERERSRSSVTPYTVLSGLSGEFRRALTSRCPLATSSATFGSTASPSSLGAGSFRLDQMPRNALAGTGKLPAADHRRRSVCPTDNASPTHELEMARHESRGLTGHPGLLIGCVRRGGQVIR
jgi:hypothetical protein